MVSDRVPQRHAPVLLAEAASPCDVALTAYIDNEPVDLAGPDLGSMLQAARRCLESVGRIVVEMELDGHRRDPSALASQQQVPLADQSHLRLVTTDPHTLASSTLRQIRVELQTARQEQVDAADLLQLDKQAQAARSTWSWFETDGRRHSRRLGKQPIWSGST